jgi:hypothetical protein
MDGPQAVAGPAPGGSEVLTGRRCGGPADGRPGRVIDFRYAERQPPRHQF